MVPIKAIQKLSLIDYPGKLCATLFSGGCNFSCPYCYNVDLVTRPEELKNISEQALSEFLEERKNFLDAICIGGGEPTIHSELPNFIAKIKRFGFKVKLDTNGSKPKVLRELLDRKLLDYIAMDVKAPVERYREVIRSEIDIRAVKESIELIKKSKIDYEFRITVVPELTKKEDLLKIAKLLKNSKLFVLQQFSPEKTLDRKFRKIKPYSKEELEEFLNLIKPYFKEVRLRV